MKIIYQDNDKSTSLLEYTERKFLELTLAGEASYDEYQTFFEMPTNRLDNIQHIFSYQW